MPLYEYECKSCGGLQEVMQRVDAAAPETCPGCGGSGPLVKIMSRTGFILKGNGWYTTDFKGGSSGKSSAKPASEDSKTPAPASETKKEGPAGCGSCAGAPGPCGSDT